MAQRAEGGSWMAEDRGSKGFWIWDFGFVKSEGQKRKEQRAYGIFVNRDVRAERAQD